MINSQPDVQLYLEKKKSIQQSLLDYFMSSLEKMEENYQNLINILEEQRVLESKYDFIEFLHLISNISNNINRSPNLFSKVEKILTAYKIEIQNLVSNRTIFNIFKDNKNILLFLFEKKILNADDYVSEIMLSTKYKRVKYPIYFYPELKRYIKKKNDEEINKISPQYRTIGGPSSRDKKEDNYGELYNNDPETFEEKRKIGLNDNEPEILNLIRDDNIDDFIAHVSKTDYDLTTQIKKSLYETNRFLYDKTASLIEYAAFYGSIQIFKFLASKSKQIELTPSLWLYAVHGDHPEIFNILEENQIEPLSYVKCYKEAVKCHHNDIANYIENIINSKKSDNKDGEFIDYDEKVTIILKYFNYSLIDFDLKDEKNIIKICKYDYPSLFEVLLKSGDIDVNSKVEIKSKKAKKIDQERKSHRWYFNDRFDHDVYRFYFKEEEKTALTMAIENDSTDIAHILMTVNKLDVNIKSSEKLWWKVVFEEISEEQVNEYIQTQDDEWYKDEESTDDEEKKEKVTEKTPLDLAILNGNEEIVRLLLSKTDIDVNQKSIFRKWKWISDEYRRYGKETTEEEELTPLYKAVENENINIVNLLISDPKIDINTLSLNKTGYIDTEKHIWKSMDIDEIQKTALHKACENTNFDIVKLLLSKNDIKVNEKMVRTKIHTYYESDMDEDLYQIHNWLIDEKLKEIDDDYEKNSSSKNDPDSHSKKININERTALDIAVRKKNQKICKILKDNNAIEIDIQSEEERYREEQENLFKERMKDDGCNIQ